MKRFLLYFILLLGTFSLYAQNPFKNLRDYRLKIVKSENKIKLDGNLDEPDWQKAEVLDSFYQTFPYDTSYSQSKTEVKLTYDDKNLYIGAVCYENNMGKYVIQSLKRDFSYPASDAFAVYIDPFNDQTNGFNFTVSPLGVQREGLIAGGGTGGVTTSWDNKWYSHVCEDTSKKCWSVEMIIPFKTIRYRKGVPLWRVNFSRNDYKRNENSCWSPVPRNFNVATLTFTGEMHWDKPPPHPGLNLSFIPYLAGGGNFNYFPRPENHQFTKGIGFDAKASVTPSLNLDVTMNPDFAQVDVDNQILNLTRFSLFFPERRQFFIENSDLFESFGFRQIRPFFSRRIGLSNGRQIPIIGGFRLSGKMGRDWRIGLMNMQTQAVSFADLNQSPQNYTVAAFQRQMFKTSNLAFILVNRQSATDFNRVAGLDFNLQSPDNKWKGKVFYHHAFTPNATNNQYAHASWFMYSTKNIFAMWNHEYVGKNYQADVGFVPRTDVWDSENRRIIKMSYWRWEPEFRYIWYPKNQKINNLNVGVYSSLYNDSSFRFSETTINPYFNINLFSTASIQFDYYENYTHLYFANDITGTNKYILPKGDYAYRSGWVRYETNKRNKFYGAVSYGNGTFYTGTQVTYNLELNYRWQPYAIFSMMFNRNEIRLDSSYQVLTLITPKADFSFSKSLFFTLYVQYNTQVNNINLYSRIQWRFKPMSDLFVVYSENYDSMFGIKNRSLVLKLVWWFTL